MAASTGGDVVLRLGWGVLVVVAVVLAWRWRGYALSLPTWAAPVDGGSARGASTRTRAVTGAEGPTLSHLPSARRPADFIRPSDSRRSAIARLRPEAVPRARLGANFWRYDCES